MNKLACLSGRFGRPGIVFIGVAALWWLITRYGAFLGAETRRDQILLLILLSEPPRESWRLNFLRKR